jgi:hypothetical protein
MVVVYLLSGPLIAATCFAALLMSGTSTGMAVVGALLIGCCAPVLIAALHVVFSSKLRLKIISKLPMKTEN